MTLWVRGPRKSQPDTVPDLLGPDGQCGHSLVDGGGPRHVAQAGVVHSGSPNDDLCCPALDDGAEVNALPDALRHEATHDGKDQVWGGYLVQLHQGVTELVVGKHCQVHHDLSEVGLAKRSCERERETHL